MLHGHPARRDHGKAKLAVIDFDDLDAFLSSAVEDVFADRPGDGAIRRYVVFFDTYGLLVKILFDVREDQTKWLGGLSGGQSGDDQNDGRQFRHDFSAFLL